MNWTWFHKWGSPKWFYEMSGRWLPWLGVAAILLLVVGLAWGMAFAPPEKYQLDSYRIIYVHVPAAFLAQSCYLLMAIAGVVSLVWKMKLADVALQQAAPIGAWLAVTGGFYFSPLLGPTSAILPLLLGVCVVFWLIGFDIIYALQDFEFDRRQKLHSLVVAWGPQNALTAAFISHMFMWGLLVGFGLLCRFRVAYFCGLIFILGCLVLEHWLARRRSLKWINTAFFKLNAVVSTVFLLVTLAEVVFPNFRVMK